MVCAIVAAKISLYITAPFLGYSSSVSKKPTSERQVKPLERLDGPIFAHGPRNPLHQFLAVGLQQHGLAF